MERAAMVEAIEAIRDRATESGVPVVINARPDGSLRRVGASENRFDRAVFRANAYRAAGADCLFVPGVSSRKAIESLTRTIDNPVTLGEAS